MNCVTYEKLKKSEYGRLLDKAMQELDRDILFDSEWFHGDDHVMRTMILGAYVAMGEKYTMEETWLLLMCCSYHDIGRIDDHYDEAHGPNAAKKIMNGEVRAFDRISKEHTAIAAAAISVHSQSDSSAEQYEREYDIRDHELFMKMVCGLKDADNLDRVRLGDLDVKYLRTKTAKNAVDFAEGLLKIVPLKKEPPWLKEKRANWKKNR